MSEQLDDKRREVLLASGDEPALGELIEELSVSIADAVGPVRARMRDAERVRFGGSGRRVVDGEAGLSELRADGSLDLSGWRGDGVGSDGEPDRERVALDSRMLVADLIINERVSQCKQSFAKAEVQAVPMDASGADAQSGAEHLLRWWKNTRLRGELRGELELCAQYVFGGDPGVAVVGVFWESDKAVDRRELGLKEFVEELARRLGGRGLPAQVIAEVSQGFEAAVMSLEPAGQEQALGLLKQVLPHVREDVGALEEMLERWRAGEAAVLPELYTRREDPKVVTYKLGEDVFFDFRGGRDLADARVIFVREVVSDVVLEERLTAGVWDAEFVEALREGARGASFEWDYTSEGAWLGARVDDGIHPMEFEVYHAYRWVIGSFGYRELYVTTFCPALGEKGGVGQHVPYYHPLGQYPFVLMSRERLARGVDKCRGVTQVVDESQVFLKKLVDSLALNAELSARPPMKQHMRRAGLKPVLAPNAIFKVKASDDLVMMNPPEYPRTALDMWDRLRLFVDEYFGRDPNRPHGVVLQQDAVSSFMECWCEVFVHMLSLAQDRMSDAVWARVGGTERNLSREDVRGQYQVHLQIDVADLNFELLEKKLGLVHNVLLRMDQEGQIERGPIIRYAFNLLDPALAQSALKGKEAAQADEVAAVQEDLVKLFFGMSPEVPDRGANWKLRLQVAQQSLQGGRFAQELQGNEEFAARAEQYLKQLDTLHQQYVVNPEVGRNVTPALQGGGQPKQQPAQ